MMHVEADLLDSVGDVGAAGRRVLEGPSKAPELSWINNSWLGLNGDIGMCVH
jgi:hypothetical protein